MRSHSFQPLLALSALLTQAVADEGRGHDAHDNDADVVTVWVESTVTTCPTPVAPPPLCSHVPVETITTTISSIVTVTTSTSKRPTPPTSKHTGPAISKPTSSATSKPTAPITSKTVPTVAPTSPTTKSNYWPWPTWMSSRTTTKPTTVHTSTGSLTKSTTTSKPDTTTTKPTVHTSVATLTKSTTTSRPDTTKTTPTVHTSIATLTKSTTTSEPDSTTTKTTTETKTTTSSKPDATSKATTWSTSEKPTTTSTTSTTSKATTAPTTTSKPPTTTSTPSTATTKPSTTTSKTTTTSSTTSASPTVKPDACSQYWLDAIKHQGIAPYAIGGSDSYKVYRNVKDYGAKGDGKTDDTAAIRKAISDGDRCGQGCAGSTTEPALVYFPPGTYIVSDVLYLYYYTMLIGHPTCLPVIKASKNLKVQSSDPNADEVLFKTNPYTAAGPWWNPTNVFWRQVANFEFDITEVDPTRKLIAIQWPSSQATSLTNIVFKLSTASNTRQIGLQITEGSGGYVGDLVLTGGDKALAVGNQQFTFRNITISNAKTAIHQVWSWGWLYQGVTIRNCGVGFDISNTKDNKELLVGSVTIIDSEISNTPVGLQLGDNTNAPNKVAGNSVILENLELTNVPVAVRRGSSTILAGSTGYTNVLAWGRGNTYIGKGSKKPTAVEGAISPNVRPSSLLSGTHFYTRSKPQYAQEHLSSFVSARSAGAKGDGVADDTKALNNLIASAAAAGKIVFLDAGYYRVTGTIRIPAGSRITAEAYPIILSSGSYFADASNPKPVVQIGQPGETGSIEWSNTVVSTRGAQAGAILIEYNLDSSAQPSGLWDVHVRIGGFAGSNLQRAQCPWEAQKETVTADTLNQECISGFLSVHITKGSSGLLMENCWVWVADHDLEREADVQRITIYAGRGMLIESQKGNIWMWGGAVEHHQLYEYQFVGAGPTVLGHIQTETAYYQPNPDATIPFAAVSKYHDPVYASGESGLGVRVVDSKAILIYGAGLYSFFNNYELDCSNAGAAACQKRVLSVENSEVSVYNLNGVGVTNLVTVDNVDVASAADGANGYVQSVALFRTTGKLLL
ncbi:pectate lyase superfamily protein-domain-containing protein [Schizothecium vesticola]|uniref:Pectate lyase superfamily protein-domain-containing protein n=1 Tax=Schizothecium vesticola TaxID=314040 RepID=A0AA40ENS3_9PEZI|nr:pectate lyase superfamily protein-domain-containing protein [Schizothecium vesticola]